MLPAAARCAAVWIVLAVACVGRCAIIAVTPATTMPIHAVRAIFGAHPYGCAPPRGSAGVRKISNEVKPTDPPMCNPLDTSSVAQSLDGSRLMGSLHFPCKRSNGRRAYKLRRVAAGGTLTKQ